MRAWRIIKLVVMTGTLSTLVTICLWSSSVRHPEALLSGRQISNRDVDYSNNDNKDAYVKTQFYRPRDPASAIDGGPKTRPESISVESKEPRLAPRVVHHVTHAPHVVRMRANEGTCEAIDCTINGEETIKCRKEGDQVFMPFDFVRDYFEVFGKMGRSAGEERFDFQHANSIPHPPRPTYHPGSTFMAFDLYNVEYRDRVKCITASEGVPITTQWSKAGYHYPIQVSQFALSHHGKHILQGQPELNVLEDGDGNDVLDWVVPDPKSIVRRQQLESGNNVVEFGTSDAFSTKGVTRSVQERTNRCFKMDVRFATNGSLTVVVTTSKGESFNIHYVFSNLYIAFDGKSNIFYGLGERRTDWIHMARDLKVDLFKGLLVTMKLDKVKAGYSFGRIEEFQVHGHGWLDNLTLLPSVHMEHFYSGADWLVRHQDSRGGWAVMVPRALIGFPELPPGWYSAMGQGQAMSVLVRAYIDSGSEKYIFAAIKALKLFQIDSINGGVRATFFEKFDWYEEYPTNPSCFVLNGFIYSLMGLYDVKETASGKGQILADTLYNSGMTSLKHMIGMFDSGVGTLYDLRHVTTKTAPNRARWDYHTTHISQILQLMVIDDDEIFKIIAERWIGYLKGKKSRHN